ncbi:MAG: pyrroline-5-carboxylate reductase [Dehalococcoidia bacterium]
MNVLVIGGGRMGKAFIKGLSHSTNHNIYLAESNIERKNELKNDFDINISNSENQIKDFLSLSDIIIICVKPQTLKLLQDDLKNKISEKQTVLSIMAGISTEKLCSSLNIENSVRIMPNTPGQLGEGISVWFSKNNINNEVKLNIETILESLGDHIKVDNEDMIDKATAISGSGPGYIYYFMEAMKRSCKEIGMDDNLSNHLIVKTFLGSAILADFSKKEFSDLKKEVTSPNGTTEAALNMMRNNNFEETIISGIKAAYNRAKELNND